MLEGTIDNFIIEDFQLREKLIQLQSPIKQIYCIQTDRNLFLEFGELTQSTFTISDLFSGNISTKYYIDLMTRTLRYQIDRNFIRDVKLDLEQSIKHDAGILLAKLFLSE